MDLEKIKTELNRISLPQYIKFIAENNSKTCICCQRWNGKIFEKEDSDRPILPLHPNCRCKYQDMPTNEKILNFYEEKKHIVAVLTEKHNILTEQANTLAKQIIIAKMENKRLESEPLFFIFNGRYLVSSDGNLALNAISGKPVSEKFSPWSKISMTGAEQTVTRTFDYSYERQGIKNVGESRKGYIIF